MDSLKSHSAILAALTYLVALDLAIRSWAAAPPPEVMHSLELRTMAFLVESSDESPYVGKLPVQQLERLAGKSFDREGDELSAAALAAAVGARELVPLFAAHFAVHSVLARGMVEWAFDPAAPKGRLLASKAAREEARRLPERVRHIFEAWVAGRGRTSEGLAWGWLAVPLALCALLVGGWILFRLGLSARTWAKTRWGRTSLDVRSVAAAIVYFAAASVTIRLLFPMMWQGASRSEVGLTASYWVEASAGLVLVATVGRYRQVPLPSLMGLKDRRGGSRSAVLWGAAGFLALWPATILAGLVSLVVMGRATNVLDNPVAVLVALYGGPLRDLWPILATTMIGAPVFEEALFRGYLFKAVLRRRPPFGAAFFSGFLFAAFHFSLTNLLPLWALGFVLALVYWRSGNIFAPMVSHALWNAVQLGILAMVFRW